MEEKKKMEIKIADNIPGGQYANAMQIRHNKDEFQLFFMNLIPPTGRIVAKIITSPGHFKRMINAMQENLKSYEKNFGEIKEADSPEKNLGFESREQK